MGESEKLFYDHYSLIEKVIVRKYGSKRLANGIALKYGNTYEDLHQMGAEALWRAALNSGKAKSNFYNYAWDCIHWGIRKDIRYRGNLIGFAQRITLKERENISVMSLDAEMDVDVANHSTNTPYTLYDVLGCESAENDIYKEMMLQERLSILPEFQRLIVKLKLLGYKDVEIALITGRSNNVIHTYKNRAFRKLGVSRHIQKQLSYG